LIYEFITLLSESGEKRGFLSSIEEEICYLILASDFADIKEIFL
jgi:hypothetical protein